MQFLTSTLFVISMITCTLAAPLPAPVTNANAIAAPAPVAEAEPLYIMSKVPVVPRQITPSGTNNFGDDSVPSKTDGTGNIVPFDNNQ